MARIPDTRLRVARIVRGVERHRVLFESTGLAHLGEIGVHLVGVELQLVAVEAHALDPAIGRGVVLGVTNNDRRLVQLRRIRRCSGLQVVGGKVAGRSGGIQESARLECDDLRHGRIIGYGPFVAYANAFAAWAGAGSARRANRCRPRQSSRSRAEIPLSAPGAAVGSFRCPCKALALCCKGTCGDLFAVWRQLALRIALRASEAVGAIRPGSPAFWPSAVRRARSASDYGVPTCAPCCRAWPFRA